MVAPSRLSSSSGPATASRSCRFCSLMRCVAARGHNEAIVIPLDAWVSGLGAAVIIGAAAGLLPAIRAARLSPVQSLWSI